MGQIIIKGSFFFCFKIFLVLKIFGKRIPLDPTRFKRYNSMGNGNLFYLFVIYNLPNPTPKISQIRFASSGFELPVKILISLPCIFVCVVGSVVC